MAVGQNQWYHFGVGAPPIVVYFSGDWDVRWGYGLSSRGHIIIMIRSEFYEPRQLNIRKCSASVPPLTAVSRARPVENHTHSRLPQQACAC